MQDSTSNKNVGALLGPPLPEWTLDRTGGHALSFANPNYVIVHNASVLEVGKKDADFSVAFWFHLREGHTGQYRSIMHKGITNSDRTFALWMHPNDNGVHYRISTTAQVNDGGDSSAEIVLKVWTHIVYVKNGNTLRLYLNGVLDSTVVLAATSVSNAGPLYFGTDPWGPGIGGDLDDVRIYDCALAVEEVASLFTYGDPLPFLLTDQLSSDELKKRKDLAQTLLDPFVDKTQVPPRLTPETPAYLKEIFYFVPMQLALPLQKAGQYVAALDWLQTVYAYNLPVDQRKIYYGLKLEAAFTLDYQREDSTWLLHSLNPHDIATDIAAPRANAYTRFTLLSLVRCFLEFADAEFTRDTSESVPRARTLYMAARDLLDLPEMRQPPAAASAANPFATNPVLQSLRMHVELQLFKLHNGRNIAGLQRQLAFSTPQTTVQRPTPYRYSVLIERTKQLVSLAQQIETAYLAALERRDTEAYNLLQAGQHLSVAEAGIKLQDLHVSEANDGVEIATLQQQSAQIRVDHFRTLLNPDGNGPLEAIGLRGVSLTEFLSAEAGAGIAAVGAVASAAAIFGTGGAALPALIGTGIFGEGASLLGSYSSFERRAQGWELDLNLAQKDVLIGSQQIQLANDRTLVAYQERNIARMGSDHAKATVNFLANKFTSVAFYEYMIGILGGVYSYFLQQATAMARLAENQLAFERQETPPSYIQADYWQPPSDMQTAGSANGKATDLRGLTGSARLLQDIYQLDQYAFETNKRKLNLSQTFSLARLAPIEFQQFRETGVLPFTTPMELLDRALPGHYLRIIKRVRTLVVALTPPTQGIRATLTASGISRVVVGGDVFQEVEVQRDPELVALTSAVGATGVFEMDVQSDMLFPFEGMGVVTSWQFQLPKAANPFDYSSVADVLITVDYTALNSLDYRQQVVRKLNTNISADRAFSFRQQFADAWYDLHNPEQTSTPMVVSFSTSRDDFPPNIEDQSLKIQQVVLYFARVDGASFEVPVTHLQFTVSGPQPGTTVTIGGGATTIDGVISTRKGNAANWIGMIGQAPFQDWELALPNTPEIKNHFNNDEIEDILFVITYSGRTPEWPM